MKPKGREAAAKKQTNQQLEDAFSGDIAENEEKRNASGCVLCLRFIRDGARFYVFSAECEWHTDFRFQLFSVVYKLLAVFSGEFYIAGSILLRHADTVWQHNQSKPDMLYFFTPLLDKKQNKAAWCYD